MAFEIEKDWITKAGLRAVVIIILHNMGEKYGSYKSHRCGYVGVPKEHPAFDKGYDDMDIDCHGGLTFSSVGDSKYPVESDLHWFGFDCHHYLDKQIEPNPAFPLEFAEEGEVRSLDYCIAECESIAVQLSREKQEPELDAKQQAITALKAIQHPYDPESTHSSADDILCELLKDLGYEEVVAEYEKVHKWYA